MQPAMLSDAARSHLFQRRRPVFLAPAAGRAFAFFATMIGLEDASFLTTSSGAEIEPGAGGPSPPHPAAVSANAQSTSLAAVRVGVLGTNRNLGSLFFSAIKTAMMAIVTNDSIRLKPRDDWRQSDARFEWAAAVTNWCLLLVCRTSDAP
jgi:hypothetical protein